MDTSLDNKDLIMAIMNLDMVFDYAELAANSKNCLQNNSDVCLLQGVPLISISPLISYNLIWVSAHATSQIWPPPQLAHNLWIAIFEKLNEIITLSSKSYLESQLTA